MTNGTEDKRIERLLEAYGADVTRWPEADRALARAVDGTRDARDAAALDRLLSEAAARGKSDATADPALVERIMARAMNADAARPGNVVPLARPAVRRRALHDDAPSSRLPAAAAALMAACLALGLFVGSLPATQTTVANIGALAGLEIPATSQPAALDEDFWTQDNEDIL